MLFSNEQGNKLAGFFIGTVVRHGQQGKCKIWIPGVYPANLAETPDKLPDAIQVAPMFGGSNGGNGVFSYPNIGSSVVCGFLNEDQNQPIYWGVIQGGDAAKTQYSEARCETSDDSVKSGDDARVHKIRVDKATVKIWESGHIEIKSFSDRKYSVGKEVPDVGCQIDISESGTITINASTQICINSPDIMINTDTYTLNCQTMKVNSGNQTELNTKTVRVEASEQVDVVTKQDNHLNESFSVTSSGSIREVGGFVHIAGKNHPPIYL